MNTKDLLSLYVANSYDVYRIVEWLEGCVAKKLSKGQRISVDHLAACSSMRRLLSLASRIMQENEGVKPSWEDRKTVSIECAERIIDNARYLASVEA